MTTSEPRSTMHQYSVIANLAKTQVTDDRAHCPERQSQQWQDAAIVRVSA